MYILENLDGAKDMLPFIRQSLLDASWDILDFYNEEYNVGGVDYEEAILVFKSPSGFIGYVKELHHFNNINTNIFGLHFNYMSSYDKDLGIFGQYDRYSGIDTYASGSISSSQRLSYSFIIRKDRAVTRLFVNNYRLVLQVESGGTNKNIYFGHYMRYGTDQDVPLPNILSGGISTSSNINFEYGNLVSIYDNKYIKSVIGNEIEVHNKSLYYVSNIYSLSGDPIVKPKPISNHFLGEYSGVLEYCGDANFLQNGDIFTHNGKDYMFLNGALIEK